MDYLLNNGLLSKMSWTNTGWVVGLKVSTKWGTDQTLFIADTETGEIIKQNNRLSKNRYEYVFWLNDENIIYW